MLTLKLMTPALPIHGFSQLWAKYVTGFNPHVHCMGCLVGERSKHISRSMVSDGEPMAMNESPAFDFLYVCGVTRHWANNLHLVLRPKPGATAEMKTFNGFTWLAEGAEAVEIPWLQDGYKGLSKAFTTCRNYQFGEAFYGHASSASAAE